MSVPAIQDILAQVELTDGSPAVENLRSRLSTETRHVADLSPFLQEAAAGKSPGHRALLQDGLNTVGELLGFRVEFGNYGKNTRRPIEFDGFWQCKSGAAFLVYLKTHDRPKLTISEMLKTLGRLNTKRQAAAGVRIFGTIVVAGTSLEAFTMALPRSEMEGQITVVSLASFLELAALAERVERPVEVMEKVLAPVDPVLLDGRLALYQRLAAPRGGALAATAAPPDLVTGQPAPAPGPLTAALGQIAPTAAEIAQHQAANPLSAAPPRPESPAQPLGVSPPVSVPEVVPPPGVAPPGLMPPPGVTPPVSPSPYAPAQVAPPLQGAPGGSDDLAQYRVAAHTAETEGRASEALQYWEYILQMAPEDPEAREGAARARMVTGGGLPPLRPTSTPGAAAAAVPGPPPSPPGGAPPPAVGAVPVGDAAVVGRTLLTEGRAGEAVPLLDQAAQAAQVDASLYRDLGLAAGMVGDREASQRAFTRCLQLLGNDLAGYREVATAALRAGQQETAEDAVVNFLTNNSEDPMAYILLGEIYGELGRSKDSAEAFENAVNLGPENAIAHCELARAVTEGGQYDRADQALQLALSLDPNLALAHAYRGDLRRLQGDPTGARTSYEKALSIDPGGIVARLGKALLLDEAGQVIEAAQQLELLLQEDPGNHKLQTALLRAQARAGQSSRTLELAEYILGFDPRNLPARVYRGIALYNLGDVEKATQALERVLEEAVDDSQVLLYLGLCYFSQQRWEESIEALEESTRHNPTQVDAYLYLGYAYRNLNNGMDAALNFTKVLNLEPDNEAAREGMMSLG